MVKFRKEEMIGKHLLVGIVYRRPDGSVEKHVSHHGKIVSADGGSVTFQPEDQFDPLTIPYNPNFYSEAEPGTVYTLAGSGQEVEDIDIVAAFEIRQPPAGSS